MRCATLFFGIGVTLVVGYGVYFGMSVYFTAFVGMVDKL